MHCNLTYPILGETVANGAAQEADREELCAPVQDGGQPLWQREVANLHTAQRLHIPVCGPFLRLSLCEGEYRRHSKQADSRGTGQLFVSAMRPLRIHVFDYTNVYESL